MVISLTMFPSNMVVIPAFNVATFNWIYIQFIEKILVLLEICVEEHVLAIEKHDC